MPITEYSIIQHRRGLYVDLPAALNTSELGHVIDQQRLFIGNGGTADGAPIIGNTEIITNYTLLENPSALLYTYQSNTPVVAQTGTTANSPIIRPIGAILDDRVSIKDYGAKGDGLTDDTAALNQAFQNIYCITYGTGIPQAQQMAYRQIFFPAGVYLVSGLLYWPPYCTLIGEGQNKTIIKQTGTSAGAVATTADSLFQSGVSMGNNSAALPTNINISNLTLQTASDQNVVILERSTNVTFTGVGFVGDWNGGTASTSCGVDINNYGTASPTTSVNFNNCTFNNTNYGFHLGTNGSNSGKIYFNNCLLTNLNYGIYTDSVNCTDVKVSSTLFYTISQTAFRVSASSTNMTSINNTYNTCGATGTTPAPVILFNASGTNISNYCSSIGDNFINSQGSNITNLGTNVLIFNGTGNFQLQNLSITPKQTAYSLGTSVTNGTTGLSFTLPAQNTAFIDYVLLQGTSNSRIGRLTVYSNGTTGDTVMGDMFTESSPTNVTFNYSISGTTLSVIYTSGTAASTWTTQIKGWQT